MKSPLLTLCAAFAAVGSTSCYAQSQSKLEPTQQLVQPELLDGSVPFARYGLWTIYQSSSEMFDNQLSCAAVASLPGTYEAIRIERVADGYVYGINGFDRERFGSNGQYPLAFWFDNDTAQRVAAQGQFVTDPAFPDDDWLSVYRSAVDNNSSFDRLYGAGSITFEVSNPGNRTGNDAVATTFPVGTYEVVQRALDRCYDMGIAYAESTEGPIPACRDDGARLPLSGLCLGSARAMINIAEGEEPSLADETCSWELGEGWFGGMIMLYRAVKCGNRIARIAGSAGAHMVELELIESSYGSEDELYGRLAEPVSFADVFSRYKPTPQADVEARALFGRKGQVPASCAARPATQVADGFIVDVDSAERARQPQDAPPAHLCGDYGYGDDADVWRAFQSHVWFFKLGQDVPEIDYRSITLIEPDGAGGWQPIG